MPFYLYVAKNKEGGTLTGQQEAADRQILADELRQKDIILISAEESGQKKRNNLLNNLLTLFNPANWLGIFGRVSLVEKMMFTRHLSVMIKAGLSLDQSLTALAEQSKNKKFKEIINQVEQKVYQGQPFSQALALYPRAFNELYVSMVEVGEASGNLDEVLKILAEQMKKNHELISRIKGAMMYPVVVVTAMIGIGIAMMILVVPKLAQTFTEMEIELPLSTRLLIGFSNFIKNHFLICLFILIALIFLIRLAIKNKKVKLVLDKIYLRLPIFGGLIQKINSARFARNFSSLIESGVAIVKALKIVANTLGNSQFRKALLNSSQQVQKGQELSKILKKYRHLFQPMIIQMVQVGEQTGSLTEILNTLANFYEEEIDNTTKNLSSIIEPIIMIIIGAAVGFFAVSMIQPMYSMMQGM